MPRALRSRRPQARQETSCTRTGRPPIYLPTQVEQSGLRRQKPYDRREQIGGVGLRRNTDEPTEQRKVDERRLECGGWGGKGADQGEHRSGPHEPDTGRGKTRVTGTGRCATSSASEERRTVHGFAPPSNARAVAKQFLRIETRGCGRSGRSEMEGRLTDLHSRVHRGAYRAQPSRRVYIPKADGRQRPLGIAALEDKIVQQAAVTILNEIYESDFLDFPTGSGRDAVSIKRWMR